MPYGFFICKSAVYFRLNITGTRDSCFITVNPNAVKAVSLITLSFTRVVFTTLTNKLKFFLRFNPIFLLSKMGNRRNRRSRRLETPSPERETSEVRVETPSQSNETLTNVIYKVKKVLVRLV